MTRVQILEIIERYKLRIPPTVYYELLADVREAEEEQEPKFIAKSDGTIEQIKNCEDCLYRKEWEKIGKLLSIILEKHIEQEPILDELRAEITTLQNRCYALTKGTMCAFCKYECEYKAESEPQESEG